MPDLDLERVKRDLDAALECLRGVPGMEAARNFLCTSPKLLLSALEAAERARDENYSKYVLAEQYRAEDAKDHHGDLEVLRKQRDTLQARVSEVEALLELDKTFDYLDDIRAQGWLVAVHNDYLQNGEFRTFWLFTQKN